MGSLNLSSKQISAILQVKIGNLVQFAAGHSDIRTTNGYCHSEKYDEIDVDILEKVL